MTTEINRDDVQAVAGWLGKELTEYDIEYVLNNYDAERANDTTASWDLVVENLIYQIVD